MTLTEVGVAIAIAVGLVGILLPILPGSVLVLAAIAVWASEVGGNTAWLVFAVATTFLVLGTIVKYAVPGFFVVPVVGLFLGFVVGVYAAERHRVGARAAWPSTKAALRAVGLSILIELAAASLAAAVWVVGVVVT
jgi:uncharacterized protein YqgC (DUF456 family)